MSSTSSPFLNTVPTKDSVLSSYMIEGCESLSFNERVSLFFKEFSLSVDGAFAKLKPSIHTIDNNKLKLYVKSNEINFLKYVDKNIVIPMYFDKSYMYMKDYQEIVLSGLLLLTSLASESLSLYNWLKNIASTGSVDHKLNWEMASFDHYIEELDKNIKSLKNGNKAIEPLGEVYKSFNDFFTLTDIFNAKVKLIKQRDIEVAKKHLDLVFQIGMLIHNKVKDNELIINENDLNLIRDQLAKMSFITQLAGGVLALLNELTAVYKTNVEELLTLK